MTQCRSIEGIVGIKGIKGIEQWAFDTKNIAVYIYIYTTNYRYRTFISIAILRYIESRTIAANCHLTITEKLRLQEHCFL